MFIRKLQYQFNVPADDLRKALKVIVFDYSKIDFDKYLLNDLARPRFAAWP